MIMFQIKPVLKHTQDWNLRGSALKTELRKKLHDNRFKSWRLDSGTLSLTKIRRSRQLSENVKDEHYKPSTTLCKGLPKCIKSQSQKKFRLSNTVRKDKGKKAKEQWRLK